MILLYTAIFEKGRYLVAAFAISLACAVLRYRLLKVSSVNYLPSRSYRTRSKSDATKPVDMLDELAEQFVRNVTSESKGKNYLRYHRLMLLACVIRR